MQEQRIGKVGSFSFDIKSSSNSIKEEQPFHEETVKSFDVYFLPEVGSTFRK